MKKIGKEQLKKISSIDEYLYCLGECLKDIVVVFSVKDTPGFNFRKETVQLMNNLGINTDLQGKHGHSYIGIIDKGVVVKDILSEKNESLMIEEFKVSDNIILSVFSSIYTKENLSVIMIDGKDYSPNMRGLNIVVYDYTDSNVIDQVVFDTHAVSNCGLHPSNNNEIVTGMKYAIGYHLLSAQLNRNEEKIDKLFEYIKNNEKKFEMLMWFAAGKNEESEERIRQRFFHSIPEADEPLRSVQKAGEILLKNFDRICSENNIDYWLTFGTLIGAVRHGGFIPWDDDVDVCMYRKDFYKLKEIVDNDADFLCEEFYKGIGTPGLYFAKRFIFKFKMYSQKVRVSMDIFIVDYGDCKKDKIERINLIRSMIPKSYYSSNLARIPKKGSKKAVEIRKESVDYEKYDLFFKKFYLQYIEILNEPGESNSIIWAIENDNYWFKEKRFFEYDYIYPLKRIQFADTYCLSPNNPDAILRMLYGNIYEIPMDMLSHKHFNVSEKEVLLLREIITKYNLSH